jgi:hypothetical protein
MTELVYAAFSNFFTVELKNDLLRKAFFTSHLTVAIHLFLTLYSLRLLCREEKYCIRWLLTTFMTVMKFNRLNIFLLPSTLLITFKAHLKIPKYDYVFGMQTYVHFTWIVCP